MKCLKGAIKHRHSKGGGHPSNYAHSIRGHSWKKLIQNGQHIGRYCGKCNKKILNGRGVEIDKICTLNGQKNL